MADDRWEESISAGREAAERTLENDFDVIQTAEELYIEYDE